MGDARTRATALLLGFTLVCGLSACSLMPRSVQVSLASKYHVTVYFTKALSFYPGSQVQVMGVQVGTVDSVTPVGARVRVVASIDRSVPLPADVSASIVPLSLIGERTLTFSPPWTPGRAKLADGAVIGQERTHTPVEIDEALKSFSTLLSSFDPAQANTILHKTAGAFQGNGQLFNSVLQQTGTLSSSIAAQDDQLLRVAQNLNRIAGIVRGRERVLGSLLSDFSQASQMAADERQNIRDIVSGTAHLVDHGGALIKAYQQKLPEDLARFSQIALIVKGDASRLASFVQSLPDLNYTFINAYDEKSHALVSRIGFDNLLRSYLAALLHQSTINPSVPCPLPPPYSNCR
jgi:phospholipid/cholesterol/gamma-HCH transport system substrate-binding protein